MHFISWSCLTKCGVSLVFLIQSEFWKEHAMCPLGKIHAVLLWCRLLCWKIPIASTGVTLLGCMRWIQAHIGAVADRSQGIQQGVRIKRCIYIKVVVQIGNWLLKWVSQYSPVTACFDLLHRTALESKVATLCCNTARMGDVLLEQGVLQLVHVPCPLDQTGDIPNYFPSHPQMQCDVVHQTQLFLQQSPLLCCITC